MDPTLVSTITSTAISFLIPYLKSLVDEFAKGIGKQAGAKTTDVLFDKTKNLYDLVKPKFEQEKTTSDLIDNFEKNPTDPKTQSVVEYHLSQYLLGDSDLLQKLSRSVHELEQIRREQINSNVANANTAFQAGTISWGTNIGTAFFVSGSDSKALDQIIERISPAYDDQKSKPVAKPKNLIEVGVKSNRFKKSFKFHVEKDLYISEFADIIIDRLNLPQTKPFPELMIRFDFAYQMSYNGKLVSNSRLADLGIVDGERVELMITTIWVDEIEEKEYEEATQGAIQYDSNQIQELIKRDVAKRARGRITETFIESLANTTFAYVENLEI